MNSVTQKTNGLESDVADLESSVSQLNTNITTLNNQIGDIDTQIEQNTNNISTLSQSINEAVEDIGSLELNLGSLNSRVTQNTSSITNINNNIDDLEEDVTALETKSSTNTNKITAVENDITNLESDIGTLDEQYEGLNVRVGNIETQLDENSEDINLLTQNLGSAESEISTLQENLESASTQISQNSTNITTINGEISDIKQDIEDINTELDSFTADDITSNANLLINSNFIVNQRGKATYNNSNTADNSYTVDRLMKCGNNSFELMVLEDGGIRIKNLSNTNLKVGQYIENPDKILNGQKVTISISQNSSVFYMTRTISLGDSEEVDCGYFYLGIEYLTSGKYFCYIKLKQNSWTDFDWWKLEFGSVATKYVARSYTEEITLCQRYYARGGCAWFPIYVLDINTVWFSIYTPSMRVLPSIKITERCDWFRNVSGGFYPVNALNIKSVWGLTCGYCNNVGIELSMGGSNPPTGMYLTDRVGFEFDAEIYND